MINAENKNISSGSKEFDKGTIRLRSRIILSTILALIIVVIFVLFIAYLAIDQFAIKGPQRDIQRQAVYAKLQITLQRYYDRYGYFPTTLSELVPDFIKSVPTDPKTKKAYDYDTLNNRAEYTLCIYYETGSSGAVCLNSGPFKPDKLNVTTSAR